MASESEAAEFSNEVLLRSELRYEGIIRAIDTLAIGDLAQVASTLVSLSSFQQRMSLERETVGEPIDVAVVSKGYVFIWIERKHYFRGELNPHFF